MSEGPSTSPERANLPATRPAVMVATTHDSHVVPALIADAGDAAGWRYVEFFTANIRNPHTRRASAHFFTWAEARGLALGKARFGQSHMGPADAGVPDIGDMLAAFDAARLSGEAPPLPPDYAQILPGAAPSLPHRPEGGCRSLGIVPTDRMGGRLLDPAPADFNPSPALTPGRPTSGSWTP